MNKLLTERLVEAEREHLALRKVHEEILTIAECLGAELRQLRNEISLIHLEVEQLRAQFGVRKNVC